MSGVSPKDPNDAAHSRLKPGASSFRGSTVSYRAVSYFVDVPVHGTTCVRERKQILQSVR